MRFLRPFISYLFYALLNISSQPRQVLYAPLSYYRNLYELSRSDHSEYGNPCRCSLHSKWGFIGWHGLQCVFEPVITLNFDKVHHEADIKNRAKTATGHRCPSLSTRLY